MEAKDGNNESAPLFEAMLASRQSKINAEAEAREAILPQSDAWKGVMMEVKLRSNPETT